MKQKMRSRNFVLILMVLMYPLNGMCYDYNAAYELLKPGFTLTSDFILTNSYSYVTARDYNACLVKCNREYECKAILFQKEYQTCQFFEVAPDLSTDFEATTIEDNVYYKKGSILY
jgi:hypothetical protein